MLYSCVFVFLCFVIINTHFAFVVPGNFFSCGKFVNCSLMVWDDLGPVVKLRKHSGVNRVCSR